MYAAGEGRPVTSTEGGCVHHTLLGYFRMKPTMERGTLWLNKDFTEMAVAIQKTGVPKALQMGSLTGLYSCEFILEICWLCFHCRVL